MNDSTELQPVLRAHLQVMPLWDFALALYVREGIEDACLTLQDDAGVDVCELLWHCWLFHAGVMFEAEPAGLAEVRRWQAEVTRPLRRLRRTLKGEATRRPGVAELRQTLKQAELEAERDTLARLEQLTFNANLRRLPTPRPTLVSHLAHILKLQRKPHLRALHSVESALDPSLRPR
ncbi:TIGR02444 family protein [Halomonas sp. TRM85114]|uniref:TIGR02444 family protein n=1 Tax=Halomonas jincaotanensis TaxID=2810616 RepID=UPI001BD2367A|nr:TIGR02444 family protein [Halomonas jincaotanensis]MBS9404652.1 TIGR02444 family protein [Halomonas jincaotanensis]